MQEKIKNDNWLGEMLSKALTEKGVPKQKHMLYVSNILGITTTAAHKKLTGATKWEVSQLIKVVQSIGIDINVFFELFGTPTAEVHDVLWNTGTTCIKCKAYLFPSAMDNTTEYSAVKINDNWHIIKTNETHDKNILKSKRSVLKIIVEGNEVKKNKKRIAILDDDENIVDNIKDIICNAHLEVDKFYSIDDLSLAIDDSPYDAYILDWMIYDTTIFETIVKIRQSKIKNAMIFVLTGQLDNILDNEISLSINDYDIIGPFEKPLKGSILKSNIYKFFPDLLP